jgi:hypothetical protein
LMGPNQEWVRRFWTKGRQLEIVPSASPPVSKGDKE